MSSLRALAHTLTGVALMAAFGASQAAVVSMHLDAAPNVYGSPNYQPWEDTAKAAASAGTFTNMAHSSNGANAGSTNFTANDVTVSVLLPVPDGAPVPPTTSHR